MAKEVINLAANFYLVGGGGSDKGPFRPMVEVALVTTEPEYAFDPGGQMVRTRTPETVRFHTTPDGLRELALSFANWADKAEAMGLELVERHEAGLEDEAAAEAEAEKKRAKAGPAKRKPTPPTTEANP